MTALQLWTAAFYLRSSVWKAFSNVFLASREKFLRDKKYLNFDQKHSQIPFQFLLYQLRSS